jgi:protein tyrosine phosphatase
MTTFLPGGRGNRKYSMHYYANDVYISSYVTVLSLVRQCRFLCDIYRNSYEYINKETKMWPQFELLRVVTQCCAPQHYTESQPRRARLESSSPWKRKSSHLAWNFNLGHHDQNQFQISSIFILCSRVLLKCLVVLVDSKLSKTYTDTRQ